MYAFFEDSHGNLDHPNCKALELKLPRSQFSGNAKSVPEFSWLDLRENRNRALILSENNCITNFPIRN